MIRMAKSSETEQNLSIIIDLFYKVYKTTKNKIFNKSSDESVIKIFKQIFLMKNHYFSYENFIVNEENNQINAVALVALDKDIHELKHKTFQLVKHKLKIIIFSDFEVETESKPNEVYLDIIAVHHDFQDQGIGTKIINYITIKYQNYKNVKWLALNVSYENLDAKKIVWASKL
ncbi:GNAT family N-acetyltransferase [Spiroplasma endosymbiont of Nebria brevicollis]|uniref:GNAT family N-acetyltransferase n=1 Tax=Spiroplasma endosymbiont of Nebria brevicollis TaxID=3066284 RepID=UPI00313B1396